MTEKSEEMRPFLAVCVLALALVWPGVAAADGTPVVIPLRYLPAISNIGPTDASGEADIVLAEGEVRITTKGLPPLTNDLYQAWLFNTKTGDRLSLGKFNANAQNQGELQTVVDLSGKVFDLVAITVQPEPDAKADPDARLTLAGFFPVEGTPTASASGATVPAPTPPPPGGTTAPGTPGAANAGPASATTPLPPIPLKLPSTGGDSLMGLIVLGGACVGVGLALDRKGRARPDPWRRGYSRRRKP